MMNRTGTHELREHLNTGKRDRLMAKVAAVNADGSVALTDDTHRFAENAGVVGVAPSVNEAVMATLVGNRWWVNRVNVDSDPVYAESDLQMFTQDSIGYSTTVTTGYVTIGSTHTWNRPTGWATYDIVADVVVEGRITAADGFRASLRIDLSGNGTAFGIREPQHNAFNATHEWQAFAASRSLTAQSAATRSLSLEFSTLQLDGSGYTLYVDRAYFRAWAARIT